MGEETGLSHRTRGLDGWWARRGRSCQGDPLLPWGNLSALLMCLSPGICLSFALMLCRSIFGFGCGCACPPPCICVAKPWAVTNSNLIGPAGVSYPGWSDQQLPVGGMMPSKGDFRPALCLNGEGFLVNTRAAGMTETPSRGPSRVGTAGAQLPVWIQLWAMCFSPGCPAWKFYPPRGFLQGRIAVVGDASPFLPSASPLAPSTRSQTTGGKEGNRQPLRLGLQSPGHSPLDTGGAP